MVIDITIKLSLEILIIVNLSLLYILFKRDRKR